MYLVRCFWCGSEVSFKDKNSMPKNCTNCKRPLSANLEDHMEKVRELEKKGKA